MAAARPRVGLLTTSFPRWPGDLAGNFVARRASAWLARGYDVDVLAAADDGDLAIDAPVRPPARLDDGEPRLSVTRIPWHVDRGPRLFYGAGGPEVLTLGTAGAWLEAVRFSAGLLATTARCAPRWQALEAHFLVPSGLVAAPWAGRLPVTAVAHSGDVALLERIVGGATLSRYLAASGADLVFVSRDLRDRFAALAGLPAPVGRVEAMAIATDVFERRTADRRQAARRSLGLEPGRPVVLAVGRLVAIKGHARLVDALAQLPGSGGAGGAAGRAVVPGSQRPLLVIVGEGPERAALVARASAAGVDLRLPGNLPPADVARWMTAADVLAHPSVPMADGRTEGQPLAVAEARAVGLPVVASRTGGLAELVAEPGEILNLVDPAEPAPGASTAAEGGAPARLAQAIAAVLAGSGGAKATVAPPGFVGGARGPA